MSASSGIGFDWPRWSVRAGAASPPAAAELRSGTLPPSGIASASTMSILRASLFMESGDLAQIEYQAAVDELPLDHLERHRGKLDATLEIAVGNLEPANFARAH